LAFLSRSAHGAVFFRGLEGFCIAGGDSLECFCIAGGESFECFCNGGGGGDGETFDGFCSFVGSFSAAGTLLLLTLPNARCVGLERRSKTSP
jgi:hypothetical protein